MKALLLGLAFCLVLNSSHQRLSSNKFPHSFKFGAGTSAYQVEGGYDADGKGLSIWDVAAHTPGRIIDNTTGDVSCDSYHKYHDDVKNLAQLKVQCYRFSTSWSRIFPQGTANYVNQAGVDYYNNLINDLLANNIEPMITLFHLDLPQALEEAGGWLNDQIIEWFVDYADKMFAMFGDRVKTWSTMNEPAMFCVNGYDGETPPYKNNSGIGTYVCAHNMIRAHARAYRLYQTKYKTIQGGMVTITLDSNWYEPKDANSRNDTRAAEIAFDFNFGWFAWPIFKTGDYPESMRLRVAQRSLEQGFDRSRLPSFSDAEKLEVFGSYDFLGLNHYASNLVRYGSQATSTDPSYDNDQNLELTMDPKWTTSHDSTMAVLPDNFYKLLIWINDQLGEDIRIAVMENGYSTSPDGSLNDTKRVDYINSYLQAVLNAINQGVHVEAYTYWSLMDTFEWNGGYTQKYGLYQVDFTSANRTRTARKSAMVYQNIVVTRSIDLSFDPQKFPY